MSNGDTTTTTTTTTIVAVTPYHPHTHHCDQSKYDTDDDDDNDSKSLSLSQVSLFSLSTWSSKATKCDTFQYMYICMFTNPNWEGIPPKTVYLQNMHYSPTVVALVRAVLLLCSDRFYIYIWAFFSVFTREIDDGC